MDTLITSPGPQVSMTTRVGVDFGQNQIQRRVQSGIAQYFGYGVVNRNVTIPAGTSWVLDDKVTALTANSNGTLTVITTNTGAGEEAIVNTLTMRKLLHLDEGYVHLEFTNPTSGEEAVDIQLILSYMITPPT